MAVGSFKLPISSGGSEEWTRPSDWLAMPTGITSADQTFVGLHAVIEDADNYVAFLFTTSAGQYQVDWGDGSTPTLHNSNTIAQYQYDFATVLSSTLTSRGYKQCIITVTPVSGNLLTCNFQQRFVTSPVQNQAYSTGFLDCILSMPNASSGESILFGGITVIHRYVERFDIKTIGGCTALASNANIGLFRNCTSLQSVPLFNTSGVNFMREMFQGCSALKTIPLFNTTNVTGLNGMLNMFSGCTSLQSIPLLNTSNVVSMVNMFSTCISLQSIPLLNTANVTNMASFFAGCSRLQSIPLLNTANVTNMSSMFQVCISLNSIPALSTASITTTSGTDFGAQFLNGGNSLNRCQMIFARTVAINTCQLSRDALVEIFTNLVDRTLTTSANINITGNWGASALTVGDRLIATAKNWTITG
jgi:surface protein